MDKTIKEDDDLDILDHSGVDWNLYHHSRQVIIRQEEDIEIVQDYLVQRHETIAQNLVEIPNLDGEKKPENKEVSSQRKKLAKLLFFHHNKTLYLESKLYYAGITFLHRIIFFLLIYVYDGVDSFISVLGIIFIAKNWKDCIDDSKKGVLSVSRIIYFLIIVKYFLGVMDIDPTTLSGKKPDFNTSLMLAILPKSSPYYSGFKQTINNSLTKYWLLVEASIFVVVQIVVIFYNSILQNTTSKLKLNKNRINHTINNIVPESDAANPLKINFKAWRNKKFEHLDSISQYGSIYLPIFIILFIAAASQYYASVLITAVIIMSIVVVYKLVYEWLLEYLVRV